MGVGSGQAGFAAAKSESCRKQRHRLQIAKISTTFQLTDANSNNHLERMEQTAPAFVTIKGMWAAKIWIVLPALIGLPIMWAFGEGDYIVPIWAVLWSGCFVIGLSIRARAAKGTVRRSQGFWVSFWSFWLALLMIVMTAMVISENDWKWCPPRDNHCSTRRDLS
jgi:hypothetical protein